jgi:N-methylhydantoinase A
VYRVGVDIGGTFTDLVVYNEETRRLFTTKVLTTPEAPEQAVLSARHQAGIDSSNTSYFMHATTLVTNLIVTRTGAKVGLITTRGFRDVLEIGRSFRDDLYNPPARQAKAIRFSLLDL